jgi:hypothetical protein
VNAVSTQVVNVPVIVREESGAQIATDTLTLAANGHLQFTLATDKYPGANGIRGTSEINLPMARSAQRGSAFSPVRHIRTRLYRRWRNEPTCWGNWFG